MTVTRRVSLALAAAAALAGPALAQDVSSDSESVRRAIHVCAACHGEKAEGQAGFPRLACQRANYPYSQLQVFRGKLRPHGVLMSDEVKSMTAAEMRAVAAYLQALSAS